jgi:hypothetical protein
MTSDYERPIWEPGDQLPRWAAKLQEPFPLAEVGLRPQIWCPKCRENKTVKYCGMKADERGSGGVEHVRKKCGNCGQNITQAHLHLSYVGHAHITDRLLQTDPRWTWRPMGRDIPDEVMTAAIATGDHAIIQTVIAAYPPKIIELPPGPTGRVERIMWGELIVHDENGDEVVMPGVGDALGKTWDPNAVKEMVGDLLRNAAMRHGAGLDLWKKEDTDRNKREQSAAGADESAGYSARAGLFDDDSAAAAKPAATRSRARQAAPADTGQAPGINPEAQGIADLAWRLREGGASLEGLRKATHEPATKQKLLSLHCQAPWDRTEKTTVLTVISRARTELEAQHAAQPAAQG